MIYTSATQLSGIDRCHRYGWLKNVAKCPEPKKGYLQFGSVLHAAAERFLKGEDPWPSGWDYDEESKTRVTPAEAALIQVLIQAAIEAGYLERRPGSKVEHEIEMEVIPGVRLRGYIDHHDVDLVEDHKTGKSVRYFKSGNALKEDIQMMIYAKWLLVEYWESKNKLPPKIITLAHNQFLKDLDNPEVRRRAAEVTPHEIQNFFDTRIKHLAKIRLELEKVTDPFSLPDPPKEACNAYGGCAFVSICSGQETYLTYKKRMGNPLPTTTMTSTSPSDFLSRRAVPAASPSVNPPPPAAAPAAAAPAATTSAPPWAHPGCQVCSKTPTPGFNSKKQPCRMCVATTKHPINDYEWAAQPDGRVTWSKKGEAVAVLQQPTAAPAGSKTAYTSPDFVAKLKTCKTTDEIGAVLQEAQKALGDGPDMELVTAAAETLIDEIIDAATSLSEKRLLEILTSIGSQSTLQSIEAFVTEAANAGATPEQMAKVNDAAQRRSALLTPAPAPSPAPAAEPAPTQIESIPVPPRRGPGRPRKDAAPAPAAPQARATEGNPEAPRTQGLVLVIGADVTLWPGVKVAFAEDILNQIPGYWQTIQGGAYDPQAAFRRRDAVRAACVSREGDFLKGFEGLCLVQRFRDPDVSNLMSSLMPHASIVITGTLL